jgi:hypothetical protein
MLAVDILESYCACNCFYVRHISNDFFILFFFFLMLYHMSNIQIVHQNLGSMNHKCDFFKNMFYEFNLHGYFFSLPVLTCSQCEVPCFTFTYKKK